MEKPREVFLDGCARIAELLERHGFRYSASQQRARRLVDGFQHTISFQSSHRNIAGDYVALWIHCNVASKRLRVWRSAQPRARRTDDFCAGGQIGNLQEKTSWCDWNLASPRTRPSAVAEAISTIERVALPYFSLFGDVPALVESLVVKDFAGMDPEWVVEFLLCFGTRSHADEFLSRFFADHRGLVPDYEAALSDMRPDGSTRLLRQRLPRQL